MKKADIGDYVICEEKSNYSSINYFLRCNIGQIIGNAYTSGFQYNVKFDNIPEDIKTQFSVYPEFNFSTTERCRPMATDEILYYSKNKKDLEMYISTNKYNL